MASQLNSRLGTDPSPGGRRSILRVTLAVAIALLSLPMLGGTAYGGEPGVCDTNLGTGKVDSFMQNTQPDGSGDWANGNMNESRADLVEGDVVPQRVMMSGLQPGENELAFTYDVWVKDKGAIKWAYDYVTDYRMEGGAQITRWYVENPEGPTAKVHVTFDVPAGAGTATLYYGAHIASELDHGAGTGAGSIDGSPYHGGLVSLNCARSGANANQIMASAIDAGTVTVVKEATPADGTDFRFAITPGGESSTFALDDDGEATLPDRVTYRVAPGTYTVEELDIPAGWNLAGIACSKTASGSTATSRTVSVADEEDVTCTFTNDKISRRDLTVSTTADASYHRDYDWTVEKSVVGAATRKIAEGESADFDYGVVVTPSAPKDSRFEVAGRISVANPNNIAVDGVTISGSVPGATCTILDGGTPVTGPVTIPAGGKDFGYRCVLGADTNAETAGTITVELSWASADYYGTTGAATATSGFDLATTQPTVTDDSVTVTDSHYDLATYPGGNVVRAADGSKTFSYPLTWPGEPGACTTYDNTATISEEDGDKRSDGARAEVCEGKDLTVDKTVVHDYYRTYDWSLSKAVVGPDRKDVGADGTATFEYEVTATAGAAEDSTWGMSGTIKVSNPNAWPVTLTDVGDTVDVGGGASCVVSKGADLVVAANSDRTFTYTCTFSSKPAYDGTNTATVTWDGTEHVSPHTSATGSAAVEAASWKETSVDKTVTVVDDKTDPANPVVLGTATWAGEGSTKTFPYTGPALEGTKGQCVDYTNNAWLEELPEVEASAKATVCWPADITVSKDVDATYDTTYFWDITKDVDRSSAEVGPDGTARFTYTVVAKPNGSEDSGWNMSGTITVRNPNTYMPVRVTLSDEYDGGGVCTPASSSVDVPAATRAGGTVTPGEAEVAYTCTFSGKPAYSGTNTVTASWDGKQATGTAEVEFRQAGRTDYEVEVLDDLTDPGQTRQPLGTARWDDPVEKRTFTNTLDLGAEPGQCVDYTNTAWVDVTAGDVALLPQLVVDGLDPSAQQTVTVCEKALLVVSKDATATYDTRYFWDVTKDVDRSSAEVGPDGTAPFTYTVVAKPDGSEDSNWQMSGTIKVTNPNAYEPATVTLSDEYDGGGVCTPESESVEVPAGQTLEVAYSCKFDEKPAYSGTNTVTASWDGETVEATAPVTFRQAGTTDYAVEVRDDLARPGEEPEVLGTARWDDPVEKRTFTNTLELGAEPGRCVDRTNTAWVVVDGDDPSAQRTVTVCEDAVLVVSKTATATYDTQYFWDITKEVDETSAEVGPDGTAPFDYTVVAKPDGSRDSNWHLSGTVSLTNPNAYKPATVTLTDVYDGGGECTLESPTVEVPAGETVEVPYTCAFTEQPAYSGTNTVTASWEGRQLTATAPVSFRQAGTTDYQVDVYDDLTEPGSQKLLGTVTWDDPVEKRTFPSTLDLGGEPGRCVDHTNTAWVVVDGGDPSAQQTVTVCEKAPLGVSKDVTATYDTRYFWDITKDVDKSYAEVGPGGTAPFTYTVVAKPNGSEDSGWRMSGTITVTNPNTYRPATVTLSDVYDGGGVCTTEPETVEVPAAARTGSTFVPGSVDVSYSCAFTEQPAYSGTNTVTASWEGEEFGATAPVAFRRAGRTDYRVEVLDDLTDQQAGPQALGTVAWDDPVEKRTFTNTLELGASEGECRQHTNNASVAVEGDDPTAHQTVEVCEKALLVVSKDATATYDTRYFWDITKEVDETSAEVGPDGTAPFDYTVVARPDGSEDSNWHLSGSISVTNPNRYKSATVTVTDVYDGGGVCTPESETVEVPKGGTVKVSYTCVFTEQPGYTGTNTVTVAWGEEVFQATAPVTFRQAGTTDYEVEVRDDLTRQGAEPEVLGTARWDDPVEKRTFTNTLELGAEPGRCVDHTNTAWAVVDGDDPSAEQTVTVCEKAQIDVDNHVTATYDTRYFWDITKEADGSYGEVGPDGTAPFTYTVVAKPNGSEDSNWQMSGTITVTNPNTYTSATVGLSEEYDGGGVCAVDPATVVVPKAEVSGDAIVPGEVEVPYTCTFTEQPDYTGTRTLTATWDGEKAEEVAQVTFRQVGRTDYRVEVYDDLTEPGDGKLLGTAAWDDPVEKRTFTNTLDLGAEPGECSEPTNTAWVVVKGDDPSAEETVKVCSEAGLVISKTVDASFDRRYHWRIDKSVDGSSVEVTGDGRATFHYKVKATPKGFTDSAYTMGGTITVTNPNTYAGGTVTATVTDVPSVGEGATCEVAEGEDLVLEPGQTRELGYTCSFSSPPDHEGTNTATATWTGPDDRQHSVSTGETPVKFRATGNANRTVTVTDSLTDPSVLGQATWNAEGTPAVFDYDLTHEGAENTCVEYTNTAKIKETGQDDSEDVTVCDQGGLVVTNVADASLDRSYRWDITKVADRDRVSTEKGKAGTVRYTVGVTPAGYKESGWELRGVVTLHNPNDREAVRGGLVDFRDFKDGATCSFDDDESFVVPAGETRVLAYFCTWDERPRHGASSTVLVDWGTDQVTATVKAPFEVDRERNRTVTVTDDHVDPKKLGEVTWERNGGTTEFGYDLELEGPVGRCETVTNTATIVETDQKAKADVRVCGRPEPKPTVKLRPPTEILPDTGASPTAGLWTTVGGLMFTVGAALLVRRRRQES